MQEHIAKITGTMLGVEDHGILTSFLFVEYRGGGEQGVGGYALDTYDKELEERVGTAYGCEFIRRTLNTVGVHKWENIIGKHIIVFCDDGDSFLGRRPLGIGNIDDPKKYFMFEDLREILKATKNS